MSEWMLGNSYDSPLGEVRWNRLDHWELHRPDVPDGQAAFYRQLIQRRADQSYTDRIQDGYTALDLPVLVCWGADDTWVPAD